MSHIITWSFKCTFGCCQDDFNFAPNEKSLQVNSKFGDLLGRGGFEHLNTSTSKHTHLA